MGVTWFGKKKKGKGKRKKIKSYYCFTVFNWRYSAKWKLEI